jgi:hypothetical protein
MRSSLEKKTQTKDNSQRDFDIKIWTLFLVLKSCLLLRDDGRKQRPDKFICFTTPFFFIT